MLDSYNYIVTKNLALLHKDLHCSILTTHSCIAYSLIYSHSLLLHSCIIYIHMTHGYNNLPDIVYIYIIRGYSIQNVCNENGGSCPPDLAWVSPVATSTSLLCHCQEEWRYKNS